MMRSLINNNFSRTYNPNGKQNALADIKRLLTSRDNVYQEKACGYLIEVISRYNKVSNERIQLVEYMLDNDITVFLCEATSNLVFPLYRSILQCLRLFWCERFFSEEHAAHSMTAALRALAHYASSGLQTAVELSLHFLCDLLDGITEYKTLPPLSHQSPYCADQLLASFTSLAPQINTHSTPIMSSALVLHSLISYQPEDLGLRSQTASPLVEVLNTWFGLLVGVLNHEMLVGNKEMCGMVFAVTCQLGINSLRLTKVLTRGSTKVNFIQAILTDEQEVSTLKECALSLMQSIHRVISELVVFTKENQNQMSTEEYGVFLKFLLHFFYDNSESDILPDFCDVLFTKGYLTMLPQAQIARCDSSVRKISTLVLGEMLKVLANKYLNTSSDESNTCSRDIHMGLVELQYGIEKLETIGHQFQKSQPYSLLIYIYFYCQSTENPVEATAPLLPYLVDHILRLPKKFTPPPYIVKTIWLVFAMSTISSGSLNSLEERVYLEKATERLVSMLHPDPSVYYTHNPAILLWSFTSQRITSFVKFHVISQWFKTEDALPTELASEPVVWEILLNILTQSKDSKVLQNCVASLYFCLEEANLQSRDEFGMVIWPMLPGELSKALIDINCEIERNICYLLDIALLLLPSKLDQTLCFKLAVLATAAFTKRTEIESETRQHYKYVCLKLSLYLLGLSNNERDNRVLLTYINRAGFLPNVVSSATSSDERVSSTALQMLSYIVHLFNKNNYKPKSTFEIQTHLIIKALREDNTSERGSSLLQLVYMVLNSGCNSPLTFSYVFEVQPLKTAQCNALRALMFRVQMICCKESEAQSSAGWKTLGEIFKHAIFFKNDPVLVATLASQPWTHTLIYFQVTKNITEEFLLFTRMWLMFLGITLKKVRVEKRWRLPKQSLISRTLALLKKNLLPAEDDLTELKQKILFIVKNILEES